MNFLAFTLFISMAAVSFGNGYVAEISLVFSQVEKDIHLERVNDLNIAARDCLNDFWNRHMGFYCRYKNSQGACLSKFYGDRAYSKVRGATRSDGKPLKFLGDVLQDNGFPQSLMAEMESTSCVGMAISCLKEAFDKTNQSNVWNRIMNFVRKNGVGGTALQYALAELGWRTYYWNPDPSKNAEWDAEDQKLSNGNRHGRWGYHTYRYNKVMNQGTYWFNKIDDRQTFVGFGTNPPAFLKTIPFWLGTAHTGYHVFPGTYNEVIEAHSTRVITSVDNLERDEFNPLAGGSPKWTPSEKYRSGMIVVPPQKRWVH